MRTQKTHYIAVLSCRADGTKLPLLLSFNTKKPPKKRLPKGVQVNTKGWMEGEGIKLWVLKKSLV